MDVFEQGADMISIITSHHDEAFAGLDVHELHSREELAEYARLSREYGVQLEYEIWHTGSIWNLELADRARSGRRAVLHEPVLRLAGRVVVGADDRRVPATGAASCPEGCVSTVSIMAPEQVKILAAAIVQGDHVRVGTEDYPYDRGGNLAETHQLVSEVAENRARRGPGDRNSCTGARDRRRPEPRVDALTAGSTP